MGSDAEAERLQADDRREKNWKRWGPYLAERQWGTVREDYSQSGDCWNYLPHDHARSRAYRWGEDGLLGLTDRECRLCFALALWNGRDSILKERLFGLNNNEGNHGEDVKESYFYLDATPTASYLKALYKYPQAAFPYDRLVKENRVRSRQQTEFELADTGVFDNDRYFDVFAEYAKASPDDILIRVTLANRGPETATLHVLPTLWFRNTWSWGSKHEGQWAKPTLRKLGPQTIEANHATLGGFQWTVGRGPDGQPPQFLFTENETNQERLFGVPSAHPAVKDAFHAYLIDGRAEALSAEPAGSKAAAHYRLEIPARGQIVLEMRLTAAGEVTAEPLGADFATTFNTRIVEADDFYAARLPKGGPEAGQQVSRQAYAGLIWSKQFYEYVVRDWLNGDRLQPKPPPQRLGGRNSGWGHVFSRDVMSMPDKWEYPWFAAWDLAFHMLPFARIDQHFAKEQLMLLLRDWYIHPNGQIPAYEFAFSDVNPPVHAWAVWRVYKMTGERGNRDRVFLERAFQKLLINFTWWVNRKDLNGRNLFSGGFLGLDNISLFDRSQPLADGAQLDQADGTAWMAFFCLTMLAIAIELASEDRAYEDVASKFFVHFVAIADAMNSLDGTGLWNEDDGFYYDHLRIAGSSTPTRIRSLVGLIPLLAVEILDDEVIERLPAFRKRLDWFLDDRRDLADSITYLEPDQNGRRGRRLLAIPSRQRLARVLERLLDENEFLSPFGVRSLSRVYLREPFDCVLCGHGLRVDYVPGDSTTDLFGGNSNWRGPIWFPLNFLFVEALQRYHHFYGDQFQVECPTGSGRTMNLANVAHEITTRLVGLFVPDASGTRPCHGNERRFAEDPHWRDLLLFHEYFHGDNGQGLGASHQTGWTALVAPLLSDLCRWEHRAHAHC